jgi:hypothetical protein
MTILLIAVMMQDLLHKQGYNLRQFWTIIIAIDDFKQSD